MSIDDKPIWGRVEVQAHLERVREHVGLTPYDPVTGEDLFKHLAAYDKVHPITPDQAFMVSQYVIAALDIARRQSYN